MPIKYNLTKYDMLMGKVKKIATAKKEQKAMTPEELMNMYKAIIVASFASGHSWKTYKILTSQPQPTAMNNPDVKNEHVEARNTKWKQISPFDIGEIAKLSVQDSTFSEWLFYNVEQEHHDGYKKAWMSLNVEFNEACDDVEREEAR
ncbi:MAG: hypothetical protein M1504_04025 [Candidatus Marsarchaeota archaeon]|nr:hypothetical protein [Candidatus Marsarchaeota archaeon]